MKLSVVIPAKDEESCLQKTVAALAETLREEGIAYEILVVNDGSADATQQRLEHLVAADSSVKSFSHVAPQGFGRAVRTGIERASGEAIAIVMADGSDSPRDLVRCYHKLAEGYDCVFGSRFIGGGGTIGYPFHKLVLNRLANWFIQILFGLRFNDVTNAFKCYRREVIEGIQPLISSHFNLTVEMPLKAIVRGYSYAVIPVTWTNRTSGLSKLRIQEMGGPYLFIVLYCWLEKHLSRGDRRRQPQPARSAAKKKAQHG